MSAFDWSSLLTSLLDGEHLSRATAAWAMGQIMEGNATEAQMAAFIVALRAKGESADEVAGLRDAMLSHAERITVTQPALDIVGTGGDKAHLVNISTMAAVVAAAAGARVVKHGNRASSSMCGSADVLEALGVVIDLPPAAVVTCVEDLGIGFCFAARFHPAMRHAGPTRKSIGIPTVFNVLGPLANPAAPAASLIGCADTRIASVMAQVLAGAGQRTLVVHGDDGLDEVSTSTTTSVWDATAADAGVRLASIDPRVHGIAAPADGALRGADATHNAQVFRAVLSGEREGRLTAVREAVLLNTAAALVADQAARGNDSAAPNLDARVAGQWDRVVDAIDSGAAAALLDRWIEVSQRLA